MALTVGAITALGALVTALQRPTYQATATILVTTPEASPSVPDGLQNILAGAVQPRSLGTQVAILRSYPVQQSAIARLASAERDKTNGLMRYDVRPQFGAEAIDILATSVQGDLAAKGANALVTEYLYQNQEQNRAQVAAATRDVAADLKTVRDRLGAASVELRNYKQKNGTVDLNEEQRTRIAALSQIEADLRQAQTERRSGLARIEQLQGQVAKMAPTEVVPERIVRRPAVEAMKGQLTQLELQRIATVRRYRPTSPEVRRLDAQIAAIRRQLATESQTEVGSWAQSVNPIRLGLSQDLARAQGEIWALEARAQALTGAASRARSQLQQLPEREYRLSQLTTDQAALQQTYRVLNEKYQALRINEGARLTNARLLAAALPPPRPASPQRALNMVLAVALGIALALGLAVLAEWTDDKIYSADEAESITFLPVLGEMPGEPHIIKSLEDLKRASPLLDRYHLLRTNLVFADRASGSDSLDSLVVTDGGTDGSTAATAVNLAVTMALSGKTVLLVDCNFRHPQLNAILGRDNTIGLKEVLRGASLENAVQQTEVAGLRFLSTGSVVADPIELLESEAGRHGLTTVMDSADVVVLVCPSPRLVADTQLLAQWAGAALIVAPSGQSTAAEVIRTRDALTQASARVLGLVLTDTLELAANDKSGTPVRGIQSISKHPRIASAELK
jgi:capsular exopolysaccharide synthesis family protein